MTGLNFETVYVGDGNGGHRKATEISCACGCCEFQLFQIEGHNHFHLQCAACCVSYCPAGGPCDGETASLPLPGTTAVRG